jgi:hypothetical protein
MFAVSAPRISRERVNSCHAERPQQGWEIHEVDLAECFLNTHGSDKMAWIMSRHSQMPQHIAPTVPPEVIERKVYLIRGHKVMLDRDLAALYRVKPIALRQQVKRNPRRFPEDFLIQLTKGEAELLVSQNVIPSRRSLGGSLPYAFTEQGVAMLSSVLKSDRAVEMNVAIMRVFVKIRTLLTSHADLIRRLDEMQKTSDKRFRVVFEAIEQLMAPEPVPPRNRIGFAPQGDGGTSNRRQLTSTGPRSSSGCGRSRP